MLVCGSSFESQFVVVLILGLTTARFISKPAAASDDSGI